MLNLWNGKVSLKTVETGFAGENFKIYIIVVCIVVGWKKGEQKK